MVSSAVCGALVQGRPTQPLLIRILAHHSFLIPWLPWRILTSTRCLCDSLAAFFARSMSRFIFTSWNRRSESVICGAQYDEAQ
jgi:hypothetical protein